MSDVTPEGDPIDTHTLWLRFPEGEGALSLDVTGFNAAIRKTLADLGKHCPDCGGSGNGTTFDGRDLGTCPTCGGDGLDPKDPA